MSNVRCPNCDSAERVEPNASNWPEMHYCARCERRFNPATWPCPRCDTEESVVRNPLDDPLEYVCLDCEFVFHHPGPSYDPASVTENELVADGGRLHLTLDWQSIESEPTTVVRFALRNVGSESVLTRGRDPIAVQLRSRDDEWWTLYGNPDGYDPSERIDVPPGRELTWDLGYRAGGLAVKDTFLRRGPVFAGEYRFVYWGLEERDEVIATQFSVT